MFSTVGGYLRDVRTLLQDRHEPYRYSTRSLVSALNITLLEVRRVRPDLLLDYLDATPQYYAAGDTGDQSEDEIDAEDDLWDAFVPMEEQFRAALVHGVAGHAQMRDQEDIQDARASDFMRVFYKILTGVDTTPVLPKGG